MAQENQSRREALQKEMSILSSLVALPPAAASPPDEDAVLLVGAESRVRRMAAGLSAVLSMVRGRTAALTEDMKALDEKLAAARRYCQQAPIFPRRTRHTALMQTMTYR